tara:strand:- start:111 stop:548 length:438 start_codon:yes stop_codon:yes gene_type:complete
MKIWFGSKSKVDKDNPTSVYDVKIEPKIEPTEEEKKSSFDKALRDALKGELSETARKGLYEYVFGDRYREQVKAVDFLTRRGYKNPINMRFRPTPEQIEDFKAVFPNVNLFRPYGCSGEEFLLRGLSLTEEDLVNKVVEDLLDEV